MSCFAGCCGSKKGSSQDDAPTWWQWPKGPDVDPFKVETWETWHRRWKSILSLPPNVHRNQLTTHFYQQVSIVFRKLLESRIKEFQMNWMHMGSWASNTVGMGVQGNVLADILTTHLKMDVWPFLHEHIENFFFWMEHKSMGSLYKSFIPHMHSGNKKVLQEVGWAFLAFGMRFAEDNQKQLSEPELQGWLLATFDKNNQILGAAMEAYYRAWWANDAKKRSEFMLYGNMLVALAEQTHLQEDLDFLFTAGGRIHAHHIAGHEIDPAVFLTKAVELGAPYGMISIAKDVGPRNKDGSLFCDHAQALEMPELKALYKKWTGGMGEDTLQGSAAHNWLSLSDRLKFIFILMRQDLDDDRWEASTFFGAHHLLHQGKALSACLVHQLSHRQYSQRNCLPSMKSSSKATTALPLCKSPELSKSLPKHEPQPFEKHDSKDPKQTAF